MNNLKEAAQKKYGCRWSELHETTREDFKAGWLAAQEAIAQPDDKAQPVVPDFDAFIDCDACCGNGFRDVEHQVAERESDVQMFREECEACGATGKKYKGIPLYAAPQLSAEQGEELSFQQIEDCFPEGAAGTQDGSINVSAQWLHDFARVIIAADRAARGDV